MNRISNYEELVAERRRTEFIIADRKQLLHDKVEDIKDKVAPLFSVLSALNIFKKKEPDNSLLKAGSSLASDLLGGQTLLKKAGLFTRLLVPPLLKVVSSKVIERVKK